MKLIPLLFFITIFVIIERNERKLLKKSSKKDVIQLDHFEEKLAE